jgi:hypothetical protein
LELGDMDMSTFLITFLLSYTIAYVISIPLHEAGHLLFGLLTGFRFHSFRLLSCVWIKEDGILVRKKSKSVAIGQCLMSPPNQENNFKFVLYNLGGGLLNFFCFFIAFLLFIVLRGDDIAEIILIGFFVANLVLSVMSLVPMCFRLPNDGYNVLKASRSPDAKHGMYLMLRVNDEIANGKRYREYDEDAFGVSDTAKLSNCFVAYIVMCEAARLYDLGRYADSICTLQRIPIDKIPRYYRNLICIEYIYDALVHNPDLGRARELYAQEGMKMLFRMGTPSLFRVQSAYSFFAKNNKSEAEDFFIKAKRSLATYKNKGMCIMEAEYIHELENLFQEQ